MFYILEKTIKAGFTTDMLLISLLNYILLHDSLFIKDLSICQIKSISIAFYKGAFSFHRSLLYHLQCTSRSHPSSSLQYSQGSSGSQEKREREKQKRSFGKM